MSTQPHPASQPTGPAILSSVALVVGYGSRGILPPIDVAVRPGEFWVVIGRNGSGKSTWFKTLLGLAPPVSGRVERARPDVRFSYVPQRSKFDDLYPMPARAVVRMGTDRGWSFARPSWREPPEVMDALHETQAAELANRPFHSLSEGQKQRVLLGRLLASRAEVALLDEPTAAMDFVAEQEAFRILHALGRKHGMAIIVVSHFLGVARDFADRALLLDKETQSVVTGTPREVFEHETFRSRYGDAEEICSHG